MKIPRFLLFAVAIVGLAGWSGAEGRTWTNSTGQLQVEAEFVAFGQRHPHLVHHEQVPLAALAPRLQRVVARTTGVAVDPEGRQVDLLTEGFALPDPVQDMGQQLGFPMFPMFPMFDRGMVFSIVVVS